MPIPTKVTVFMSLFFWVTLLWAFL
jgi:hypothetical protein